MSSKSARANIVDAIVDAGGKVQYVTERKRSLEDLYLNMIREGTPE
ncbi:MAG: hypothetical protein V3U49_08430 [Nitrososphaerales archaeon]